MPSLLNLGCGTRLHSDWTNVDLVPAAPGVVGHDVSSGIPFDASSFDAVYHSHLLEHLSRDEALFLLRECRRVLRPGGVIRVVVPDLQELAETYLKVLADAIEWTEEWQTRHEWMLLELLDQMVRERSGGDMALYLLRPEVVCSEFVMERAGPEGKRIIEQSQGNAVTRAQSPLRRASGRNYRRPLRRWRKIRPALRERLVRCVLRSEYALLQLGRFRRSGEVHRWMYDRWSLARLLHQAGFVDAEPAGPLQSRIQGWTKYNLDTERDGTVYKPGSLYMEASKPCGSCT